MKQISILSVPGFNEWRQAARECVVLGLPPHSILWGDGQTTQNDMFTINTLQKGNKEITAPKSFLTLAETACCYRDPAKYDLLYRLLWRLNFENRHLLHLATDDDVIKLNHMVKAVRRDAYKITAFLRFREIRHEDREHFVAWYETEHYSLERVLPFFQTRFRNMHWSILTPYRAAHWDQKDLILEDNPNPDLYPKEDQIEQYWLGYYANIFNPARPKKSAMLHQMPKKYWKNMPETVLVQDLLRGADTKVRLMIDRSVAGK